MHMERGERDPLFSVMAFIGGMSLFSSSDKATSFRYKEKVGPGYGSMTVGALFISLYFYSSCRCLVF